MKTLFSVILLLLLSANGFSQWIHQNAPGTIAYLNSINFSTSVNGVCTGWGIDSQTPATTSRAYYTTNAGATWNIASVPDTSRVLVSTEFITSNIVYATGAMNGFFSSAFSSNGYNKLGLPTGNNRSIDFSKGAFFKSTDGGRTWKQFGTVPSYCYYMTYSDFINENSGMALGSITDSLIPVQTTIMKTTNGGLNWINTLPSNIMREFKAIKFVNENLAFTAGLEYGDTTISGIVMRTTNGGLNWTTLRNDTINYTGVYFINSNTGFLCGTDYNGGLILKTTNQGNSWEKVFSRDSLIMEDLNFLNETGTGIVYGEKITGEDQYKPFVLRTSNFGANWSYQIVEEISNNVTLIGSSLIDRYKYFLTGGTLQEGKIYFTSNGGSTSVSNEPSPVTTFALKQNFPNPFNPVTVIRYSLPAKGYVNIKVYNSVGKEIVELINEIKAQGVYEVKFNGENLPSGIYYYTLKAENYSETRKMILLK
ncbi:MAG: T9SS type A sorting domain-containing protein [Bacteroidetes bacterium]|nr:T9SS type A sorting domain-containing protein [Bacteroidota bacterium]